MKKYIVTLQCHIVKERCSGYLCEHAFNERSGCFEQYKDDKDLRLLTMTCGGCCGRATQRKLVNMIDKIKKKENISKDEIVVHLSSCIAFESHHDPKCPHKDYLIDLIEKKTGLEVRQGSNISKTTEELRAKGVYEKR